MIHLRKKQNTCTHTEQCVLFSNARNKVSGSLQAAAAASENAWRSKEKKVIRFDAKYGADLGGVSLTVRSQRTRAFEEKSPENQRNVKSWGRSFWNSDDVRAFVRELMFVCCFCSFTKELKSFCHSMSHWLTHTQTPVDCCCCCCCLCVALLGLRL